MHFAKFISSAKNIVETRKYRNGSPLIKENISDHRE